MGQGQRSRAQRRASWGLGGTQPGLAVAPGVVFRPCPFTDAAPEWVERETDNGPRDSGLAVASRTSVPVLLSALGRFVGVLQRPADDTGGGATQGQGNSTVSQW